MLHTKNKIGKAGLLATITILFVTAFNACNSDFLDNQENESYFYLEDTILITDQAQEASLTLVIPNAGNANYTVSVIPKWLEIDEMQGRFNNNTVELHYTVNQLPEFGQMGFYQGQFAIHIEGLGTFYGVIYYGNLGNPTMTVSPTSLSLGTSLSATIRITNSSQSGILVWQISDLPDWLTTDQTIGFLYPSESIDITFNRQATNLDFGDYEGTISILNNSSTPDFRIPVSMKVVDYNDPDYLKQIDGDVVDVEYNKTANLMAIACKSPNKLHLYQTADNTITSIDLNETPNCVSIAEDGTNILLGNTNSTVTKIDVAAPSSPTVYTIDCIPYDIVYGSNNWCYITPTEDQWVYFRSMNLETGEVTKSAQEYPVYEKTIIKKIPGKDQLLGTRTTLSPTGILLFDLSPGIAKENVNYWHEGIGPFWLSENGDKFYCNTGKIYSTPEYSDENVNSIDISAIGDLGTNWDYPIQWVDQCEAGNSLFVLRQGQSYNSNWETSYVEGFNSYNYVKTGDYEPYPVLLTINGTESAYDTRADYVFASKEGTSIYLVKTIKSTYEIGNYWSIEKIDVAE